MSRKNITEITEPECREILEFVWDDNLVKSFNHDFSIPSQKKPFDEFLADFKKRNSKPVDSYTLPKEILDLLDEPKKEEPKPIHVTQDGVAIFEYGVFVYELNPDWSIEKRKLQRGGMVWTFGSMAFSTKEAAEDYIKAHKPVISQSKWEKLLAEFYYSVGKLTSNLSEVKEYEKRAGLLDNEAKD